MWLLFILFQLLAGVLYLFVSALLLYRPQMLIARWFKFTCGYFIAFMAGGVFFFGEVPPVVVVGVEEFVGAFMDAGGSVSLLRFLFFFGSFALVGWCLFRQLTRLQTVGLLLTFWVGLIAFWQFTELQRHGLETLEAQTRSWIEFGSVAMLVLGLFWILGFRLFNHGQSCWRETFGSVVMFLTFMAGLLLFIRITIG